MKSIFFIGLFSILSFLISPAFAETMDHQTAKEGEILQSLITSNKNEIAVATLASRKNLSPSVKNYAQVLLNDHEKNLKDTQNVSQEIGVQPVETPAVATLKQKGQRTLSKLRPLKNKQFEMVYLNAMVKSHEDGLNRLDTAIESVQNPVLKKHLMMTRTAVAHHLQMTKDLKKELDIH